MTNYPYSDDCSGCHGATHHHTCGKEPSAYAALGVPGQRRWTGWGDSAASAMVVATVIATEAVLIWVGIGRPLPWGN